MVASDDAVPNCPCSSRYYIIRRSYEPGVMEEEMDHFNSWVS